MNPQPSDGTRTTLLLDAGWLRDIVDRRASGLDTLRHQLALLKAALLVGDTTEVWVQSRGPVPEGGFRLSCGWYFDATGDGLLGDDNIARQGGFLPLEEGPLRSEFSHLNVRPARSNRPKIRSV